MVFIIRKPHDVHLAEWNRRRTGESHTEVAPLSSFGKNLDYYTDWRTSVYRYRYVHDRSIS